MNTMTTTVHASVEDVLGDLANGRPWRIEPMDKHVDSLSGSPFERAYVGDEPYVVKHIARDLDWLMRVLDDGADGTRPRALIVWQEGLHAQLPAELDHVTVGMAYDPTTGHLTQVMRDAGAAMIPAGGDPVPLAQHRKLLDHMAALHAAFWGFQDSYGLTTPEQRYGFAHPDHTVREQAAGHTDMIPGLFPGGWAAMRELSPEAADLCPRARRRPDSADGRDGGWSAHAGPRRLEVRQPRQLAGRSDRTAGLGMAG